MNMFESFGAHPHTNIPEVLPVKINPEMEKTHETAAEILQTLDSVKEFVRVPNQRALLTEVRGAHLIVRREDPNKILELINDHEPISLSFVGGTPYANSVEWNPQLDGTRGLDNAYLEGFSHKDNVVMVYGFEKPDDFYFKQLDDSERVFNGVDRSRVRAAAGFVPLEAIQFVTVRIPVMAMNESELNEEEADALYDFNATPPEKRKPLFVYRTYIRTSTSSSENI